MNYRIAQIIPRESITADKSWTVDVNMDDPISKIVLQARYTNNGSTPTAHPAKILTKIEIVDGSQVIQSLTGIQAQALAYYHSKRVPWQVVDYDDNHVGTAVFELHFGRRLYDPMYALDPKRFKNLQLKVSYDEDGGGSAPDAGELQAKAFVFDEKQVSPVGCFVAKEQYTYTLVASGYELISLPVDMPMRILMVQSLAALYPPNTQMSQLRLSEDHQKRIVFDERVTDLIKDLAQEYPPIQEAIRARLGTTPVRAFIMPAYEPYYGSTPVDGAATYEWVDIGDEGGGAVDVDGQADAKLYTMLAHGLCPHGAIGVPFGNLDDPDDWYDVRKVKELELRVLAGSGCSGTAQVVTQQVLKY